MRDASVEGLSLVPDEKGEGGEEVVLFVTNLIQGAPATLLHFSQRKCVTVSLAQLIHTAVTVNMLSFAGIAPLVNESVFASFGDVTDPIHSPLL